MLTGIAPQLLEDLDAHMLTTLIDESYSNHDGAVGRAR